MPWSKLEDAILSRISSKTLLYFGKIVDKHRGARMSLDSLNPVVLSDLPPLFKFKRFTSPNLYNQAIGKMKSTRRYTDTETVYYDGACSSGMYRPTTTLYVHYKAVDVMIVSYTLGEGKSESVLEILKREIVESKEKEYTMQCIKSTNATGSVMYEVRVDLVSHKAIKWLLFQMFEEDVPYKRNRLSTDDECSM